MMRTLMTLIVVAGLTGCAGMQKPHVAVASVGVAGQSDEGTVLDVTLKLDNPNRVQLPVYRVDYRVSAGDQTFDFKAHPPVAIPVQGEQMITLPAAFTGTHFAGQPVQVDGRVYYQPPGEWRQALRDLKIPWPHVSFSSNTTLK